MQTLLLHHTVFPIPTQRLCSQRISCAPQGFPSPHVRDLLEYRRDPRCELGSRTSSSSYVLLDPSWRPQLPRQVCGEQHTPLCSHQGERRGRNESGLDWGGRCWAEQVFGSHTLSTWVFETSEVCSCASSRSAFSPCSVSSCLLLYTAFQSRSCAVVLSCSKFLSLIECRAATLWDQQPFIKPLLSIKEMKCSPGPYHLERVLCFSLSHFTT